MLWKTREKSLRWAPQTGDSLMVFEKAINNQSDICPTWAPHSLNSKFITSCTNMDRIYFHWDRWTSSPSMKGERRHLDIPSWFWGGIPREATSAFTHSACREKGTCGLLICPLDRSNSLPPQSLEEKVTKKSHFFVTHIPSLNFSLRKFKNLAIKSGWGAPQTLREKKTHFLSSTLSSQFPHPIPYKFNLTTLLIG